MLKTIVFYNAFEARIDFFPRPPDIKPLPGDPPSPFALRGLISGRKAFPFIRAQICHPRQGEFIIRGVMGLISVRLVEVYYRAGVSSGRWRLRSYGAA